MRRYADDPELLARQSANALEAARSELNWSSQGERLVAFYDALTADLVTRTAD